jgi:16S rRNA processing protein RimM
MHANPDNKREMVLLGRITGAHGIKGWARIHSDTEPREAIFEYQPWLVGATEMPVQVLQGKRQGKYLVAELAGISDRDAVESLAGQQIAVYRDQLPDLGDRYYYWTDLIGLRVYNQDGVELGSIREMIATGANDVMLVQGDKERLIPFIKDIYVTRVDRAARRVTVSWDPDF